MNIATGPAMDLILTTFALALMIHTIYKDFIEDLFNPFLMIEGAITR
jgi:hypothetical protein